MGDPSLVAALSMEAHQHPSTLLSMDSSASSHDELDLEMNPQTILLRPPDINLPLSAERSPRPPPLQNAWNPDQFDILDVTLGTAQVYEPEALLNVPKAGRKLAKRVDSIWGAWFFFSFYFKPVVNDKSVAKIMRDGKGVSGFDKSDLKLDVFMVQHDMENMYMWIFKERPENALGKMQLRSYMNGHSRHGDRPFPYSVDKGFVRSHRMQRKHYRGLSNPQCIHGIEVIPCPNLASLNKEDRRRWVELTGREINFSVPPEASAFGVWRNLPNTDFELERPMQPVKCTSNSQTKKLLNGSGLNLSAQMPNSCNGDGMDLSPVSSKRRKGFFAPGGHEDPFCVNTSSEWNTDMELHMSDPQWLNEFSGVMKNVNGPVTAAKTIYEDDEGYLIIISLPFVDLQKVKVSWRNTPTRGIIKVSGVSVSQAPFIRRNNRTFKLSDPAPEHCPSGEFIREITLSTRIPEEANIKAYCPGSVLEITVPKLKVGPEEHEVHVCLRPHLGGSDLMLT